MSSPLDKIVDETEFIPLEDYPYGNLLFALGMLIPFIIGLILPGYDYMLLSGLYVVFGLARTGSDRFDKWAREQNLIEKLTIVLVVVAFLYVTWRGPVPNWLP